MTVIRRLDALLELTKQAVLDRKAMLEKAGIKDQEGALKATSGQALEISFTRYFYQPPRLRSLDEIRGDIEALETETEGLLEEALVGTKSQSI